MHHFKRDCRNMLRIPVATILLLLIIEINGLENCLDKIDIKKYYYFIMFNVLLKHASQPP